MVEAGSKVPVDELEPGVLAVGQRLSQRKRNEPAQEDQSIVGVASANQMLPRVGGAALTSIAKKVVLRDWPVRGCGWSTVTS